MKVYLVVYEDSSYSTILGIASDQNQASKLITAWVKNPPDTIKEKIEGGYYHEDEPLQNYCHATEYDLDKKVINL